MQRLQFPHMQTVLLDCVAPLISRSSDATQPLQRQLHEGVARLDRIIEVGLCGEKNVTEFSGAINNVCSTCGSGFVPLPLPSYTLPSQATEFTRSLIKDVEEAAEDLPDVSSTQPKKRQKVERLCKSAFFMLRDCTLPSHVC